MQFCIKDYSGAHLKKEAWVRLQCSYETTLCLPPDISLGKTTRQLCPGRKPPESLYLSVNRALSILRVHTIQKPHYRLTVRCGKGHNEILFQISLVCAGTLCHIFSVRAGSFTWFLCKPATCRRVVVFPASATGPGSDTSSPFPQTDPGARSVFLILLIANFL